MKTDRTVERSRLSRRSVLRVGSLAAGGGVLGVASGTGRGRPDPVVVAATEPYLESTREWLEGDANESGANESNANDRGAYDGGSNDGDAYDGGTYDDVEVQVADPAASAAADGADVRVSGEPFLLTEHGEHGGDDGDARAVHLARIDAVAALAHSDGEWRECLHESAVRTRCAAGEPVETWVERDRAASLVGEAGEERPESGRESGADGEPMVLGTRAYQYAAGRGGLGFYGVEPGDLAPATEVGDSHAPIGRVAFVRVAPANQGDDTVRAIVESIDAATVSPDDRFADGRLPDDATSR